jgi:hypothetical protein
MFGANVDSIAIMSRRHGDLDRVTRPQPPQRRAWFRRKEPHDAHPSQIEARPLSENQSFALFYHIVVRPNLYLRSMLGSPNLRRRNAPLAMRLKIDDLHAHVAPLDRYGLPGLSSAMTAGFQALARVLRAALCCSED